MQYDGKVVIVTGAGTGMGRAMVAAFVGQGARVAAIGRRLDKLVEAADATEDRDRVMTVQADVTVEADVSAAMKEVIGKWGRIDLLCNNAGVLDTYHPAHEVSLEEWNHVMAVNVTGPFLTAKYTIPHMLTQGKGAIINIASTSSFSAASGGSAYTASKHAVLGLTRQLCFEYGVKGVRVNAICPGVTATPMTLGEEPSILPDWHDAVAKLPGQRICRPEEIAKLAVFLGSDDADYVHGSAYVMDGGWLTAAREAF